MNSRLLIILGIGILVFGLVHLFSYFPISFPLLNTPFPFEHVELILREGGSGKTLQIGYMPIDEAIFNPYWLFWSLSLYAGIIVTGFSIWRKRYIGGMKDMRK